MATLNTSKSYSTYDVGTTYNVGDDVLYLNNIYKCIKNFSIDSYGESNYKSYNKLYWTSSWGYAQCFTAISSKLTNAKFYLSKTGSPTGNATARLYAITGTFGVNAKPTGSALATSDNFDVSTLTTSPQLITFNFTGANQYSMSNTYYCIALIYLQATSDSNNYVRVGIDTPSPAQQNNFSILSAGTWYAGPTTIEMIFYVLGVGILPTNTTYWSNIVSNSSKNSATTSNPTKNNASITNSNKN